MSGSSMCLQSRTFQIGHRAAGSEMLLQWERAQLACASLAFQTSSVRGQQSMPISQLSCESFGYGVAACAVACSQWGGSRLRHDAAFAGRDLEGVSDPRCYRARVLQYGAMVPRAL